MIFATTDVNDINNMSNKEAAEIIRNLLFMRSRAAIHNKIPRGNGKSTMDLARTMALSKAIILLEETPDKER